VDRANLQKEVDALKSEINRIADSSNFNGINLLDGKLGLNEDAFTISSAEAVEYSSGVYDGADLITGNTHLETTGGNGQKPGAVVDLGNIAITVPKGTTDGTVTVKIGGQEIAVKMAAVTTGDTAYTATTIGTNLATELKKSSLGVDKTTGKVNATSANNNDAIKLGNGIYSVTAASGKLTLAYEGYYDSENDKVIAAGTTEFTEEQAKEMNDALGTGIEVSGTTGGDYYVHATTTVDYAKPKTGAGLAGADVQLNSNIVSEGGTLTIDGNTYKFKVDKDSTLAGTDVIDVSSATSEEERVHMAVDLLSKQGELTGTGDGGTRKWKIASAGNDTIHIEQSLASATNKAVDSMADLTELVSAKGKEVKAANVGTKITIDDTKVSEGDTLTIDGKAYVFTKDATKTDTATTAYVSTKGDVISNLKAKISGDNIAGVELSSDGKSIIVRSNDAEATSGPSVLGKGVVLQIGDTSDSYNQLGLTINDIHTNALGLDGVSIADQDDAQSAIQIIKNAINNVSSTRGDLGALQNRLEHTANNLSVMSENIQDAESTIRDTDIAEEMMSYTKNSILVQSAQAMLAQANTVPQGVLQLLQ
jgi:flagellin